MPNARMYVKNKVINHDYLEQFNHSFCFRSR